MLRFDEQSGRITRRVVGMLGQNTLVPRRIGTRSLQEGEATYASNVRVRSGKVIPGKEAGDESFSTQPTEIIYAFVEYQLSTPYLVLLDTTKCWVQQSGDPVLRTPATPFSSTSNVLWHGHTMLTSGLPIVVVNNSGVDVPHYYDDFARTLSYGTGDDGTGDTPDVGDTVTGAAGSTGIILAITTATGSWAGGDAAGVLTLRACTGDWADTEVLTFTDGETAAATAASAKRAFLPLSNAPNMRCMIGFQGCLYGGNVQPASTWLENRLQWSDRDDITAWGGVTSGNLDLDDEGDALKRLSVLRGNLLSVFRRKSIYLCTPTGDPGDPVAAQPFANRGILAVNSLQRLEQEYLFLGDDDIYLLSLRGIERAGKGIRTDLFRDADESKLQYAWSFMDRRSKDYYLVTAMADGTTRAWMLNYEDAQWATQDVTGYTALTTWRED